jgi:hypothetical protein
MSETDRPVEQATAAPGEQRMTRRPPNLPAEPGETRPLPNRADAAWEELETLRSEARALGIAVDDHWPIARLREEIAHANAGRDR